MARQPVGSREYKVMLVPERFAGSEEESRLAVDRFWSDVGTALTDFDIPTHGSFDEVKAHRRIRFLDTAQRDLNGYRYIFRKRVDVECDEREMTLKYRHADRYVAQDRDMRTKGDDERAETKFEEDVKPPFVSVFSYSTTVVIDGDQQFGQVDEEDYRGSVTREAHDVLQVLHAGLPAWVDPQPRTKAAFVYA